MSKFLETLQYVQTNGFLQSVTEISDEIKTFIIIFSTVNLLLVLYCDPPPAKKPCKYCGKR